MRALVLCLLLGLGASASAETCLASLFGARPSTTLYATSGIQAAIDYCAVTGGTVVLDEQGTYLTAALTLSSEHGVQLEIPAGVTLLAGDQASAAVTGIVHAHMRQSQKPEARGAASADERSGCRRQQPSQPALCRSATTMGPIRRRTGS